MRTDIRCAMLAIAISLSTSPAASAAAGGGATVGGPAAKVPVTTTSPQTGDAATGDDVETRTVKLTRTQTKSMQKRIHVSADGALGGRTRKAIKRYQVKKALLVTSAPNVQTLRSLGLRLADKLEAKMRAAQVSGVQNVPVSAPTGAAAAAIEAARSAIGTPYRSGGTTTAGFDCSGLMVWAFAKAGVKLPRTSFDQYGAGTAIDRSQIQPGDLVFFDSAGAGASHVGIATSPTTVISATSHGVMEHSFSSGYWDGHYVGARRLASAPTAVAASVRP